MVAAFEVEHSFYHTIFETDSTPLVSPTKVIIFHPSLGGRVYDDIISLILELPNSYFSHIFREINTVAHTFACYACIFHKHVVWLSVLSYEIRSILSVTFEVE